jgi:hypothetical protein
LDSILCLPGPRFADSSDPDDQVRAVVRLIFDKFDELGTAHAVTRCLRQNHIRLGIRPHDGPNRGNLEWRPALGNTVYRILTHPAYAGTYEQPHRDGERPQADCTPHRPSFDGGLARIRDLR